MYCRQGDVLLYPTPIPAKAKAGIRDQGKIVLAYGEKTGHRHSIAEASAQILEHEGLRYLQVSEQGAVLHHEEHRAIPLAGGEYRVITQREYTPQAIVNVLD